MTCDDTLRSIRQTPQEVMNSVCSSDDVRSTLAWDFTRYDSSRPYQLLTDLQPQNGIVTSRRETPPKCAGVTGCRTAPELPLALSCPLASGLLSCS